MTLGTIPMTPDTFLMILNRDDGPLMLPIASLLTTRDGILCERPGITRYYTAAIQHVLTFAPVTTSSSFTTGTAY